MSDGIFISNRPQLAIARQSASFASLGLNDPTLTRSITKIGSPFLSYYPTDEYNAIEGVEEGASYLLYVNSFFDGSPVLVNAVLDNLIPQTTTNVFAGEPTVFICTTSVDFVTAGITTLNTTLIVLVDEGYFVSYDPTDSENGISGFVEGSLYYIDPILDIDLSDWGVTEVRYADEVLYLNDLEDVVETNANPNATLPLDQEEILVRNATTGLWENQVYNPGTPVEDIPDGLISGGIVTWESGLTFRVTAAVYYIDGVRYESSEQTITLDAADPTNPRFDVLVLDDTGTFTKITGVPAADPSEPQIDQSTQLYLTTVLVGAGATTPTGVSTVIVYDENTEWTASSAGTVSVNFNNTTNPSNGTKSAAVASWSSGATLVFTNSTTVNTGDVNSFSLRVWLTASLTKSQNLSIQFFNGATAVSLQQPIAISKTTTGAYQTFSLAEIDWTGAVFDRVKILLGGNNSNVLYIDEIRYQTGISQPTGAETDPTVHPLIKAIPTSIDATTNKYLNWNGSAYVKKQVDYSEIGGDLPVKFYADEASFPGTGVVDTIYAAKAEETIWYWDGADYVQLGGGGSSYTFTKGLQESAGTAMLGSAPVTATDAAYVVGADDYFIILPTITANRSVTLPDPALHSGRQILIWNTYSATTFAWSFSGSYVPVFPTGTTSATIGPQTVLDLVSDGTNWVKGTSGVTTKSSTSTVGVNQTSIKFQGSGGLSTSVSSSGVETTITYALNGDVGSLAKVNDANYSVAAGITDVIFHTMTADRTLTLPSAGSGNNNRRITIKNGGNGAFNINLSSSVKINNASTQSTVAPDKFITIMSDGTDWWIVANN
jgi:hypothetical protein